MRAARRELIDDRMTDKEARRLAASEWFLEVSVLWAVFPLLDRIVEEKPIVTWLVALGAGISLTTAVIGMILRRGEQ